MIMYDDIISKFDNPHIANFLSINDAIMIDFDELLSNGIDYNIAIIKICKKYHISKNDMDELINDAMDY